MDTRHFERETRLTEFTARNLWWLLRPALRRYLSRRCSRCVLPESYAAIGADGTCEVCAQFDASGGATATAPTEEERRTIDRLLREHQGRGRGKYDAILLFSGGKDSALLLHRISTEYPGLRLLTLLVDNGFMSPFALANAQRVQARFDVEHLHLKLKPSFVRQVFRYTLTHLELQTGYSIVDLMDGHMTFDASRNLAARLEVPLIICGLSRVQVHQGWGDIGVEFPRELERAPASEHAGLVLSEMVDAAHMDNWWDGSRWPEERIPRFLFPNVAWDPDEPYVVSEVARLGLLDPRRTSPLLTNNSLIPVIGMAEVARFGYSSFEVEFARMVREGKSERGYWLSLFEMLEYSTKSGRFVNKTVEHTLARLGLTKRDLGILQR